jgi:c(7)-type cytochrome triheme protein
MKKMLLVCLILLTGSGVLWAGGTKRKKALPNEFGSVTISNFSQQAGMAPVVFDHWVHRKNFTCRLCHVDIGFGMSANSTKIRAADNMKGYFCGTCHNGSTSFNKVKIFESCANSYSREEYKRCLKCHALEKDPTREEAFYRFLDKMPRETFGNGINWEKAEENGSLKLMDHLEGVSVKKSTMKVQADFSLKPKVEGMPDIIFSHAKHTVWNGCEVCHPDIFVGIKKGATKYSMIELFDGKYCGVCHDKVAFPQTDCKRCHVNPV